VVNNNLKKKDLAKNLSLKTGFSLSFSQKLVDDLVSIIINDIKYGNLKLKNIGSFKLLFKKERKGRNPKTREEFLISKRKIISFIVSKNIKNRLERL
jgi:integration host factor subunit alpha